MSRLLHGARIPLVANTEGIKYLLRDEFTTADDNPLTSPRTCEPGPGTIAFRDVEGKLTIAGGWLNFAAQATAVYAEEDAVATSPTITRSPGRLVICKWKCTTDGPQYPLALVTSTTPAWNHTNVEAGFWRSDATTLSIISNAAVGPAVTAFVADGTEYLLAIATRAAGAKFYIKGGTDTNWTKLFESTTGATATLYLAAAGNTAVFAVDFFRDPALTWLDAPLISDGFGGTWPISDGAGHAESTGIGLGGSGKTWQGLTWLLDTGALKNTRVIQPETLSLTPTIVGPAVHGYRLPKWMTTDGKIWSFYHSMGVDYNTDCTGAWTHVMDAPAGSHGLAGAGAVTDTDRLIFTFEDGTVYVSDEAQTAWTLVYTFPVGYASYLYGGIYKYKNILLISSYGDKSAAAPPRYVIMSVDDGANWDLIYEGGPSDNPSHVHDVAYDPWADRIWLTEGDNPHRTIKYADFTAGVLGAWVNIWPAYDSTIQPTFIAPGPDGILFGSDLSTPDGLDFWPRPAGASQPVVAAGDFVSGYYPITQPAGYRSMFRNGSCDIETTGRTNYTFAVAAVVGYDGYPILLYSNDGVNIHEIWRGNVGDQFQYLVGPLPNNNQVWGTILVGGVTSRFNMTLPSLPVGSELLTNPYFGGTYVDGLAPDWTKVGNPTVAESADPYAGTAAQSISNSTAATDEVKQDIACTIGAWYHASVWVKRKSGTGYSRLAFGANATVTSNSASYVQLNSVGPATGITHTFALFNQLAADEFLYSKASIKKLLLKDLFASIQESCPADVYASVDVTAAIGFQGGLVNNLDDKDNPANLILCYYNRCSGKVILDKYLAGTRTNLLNPTIAYSAGAKLTIRKVGLTYYVWYNNALAGTWTANAITDANIINNTLLGTFSTGNSVATVSLDNFAIYPSGSGNEIGILDRFVQ